MALPRPVTTTDEFLVAVHTELVGLRADLAASRPGGQEPPPTVEAPQVELREPTARPARRRT